MEEDWLTSGQINDKCQPVILRRRVFRLRRCPFRLRIPESLACPDGCEGKGMVILRLRCTPAQNDKNAAGQTTMAKPD